MALAPVRSPELITVTAQRPPAEGFRPTFTIQVDGQDRSEILAQRLLSINLTDNSGGEADTLELAFDDSHDETLLGGAIEMPRKGAVLALSLGYIETGVLPMGTFVVDETELSGPPDTLLVRARSGDLRGAPDSRWKAQKTRSHRDTTVGAIVARIAGEHATAAVVEESFKGRTITHIDQTNESDLHFLTRVARREGAIFTLKGGTSGTKAIFAKSGSPRSASGAEPSTVTLTRSQLINWRMTLATRDAHGSVIAKWRDKTKAKVEFVTAGLGDPKRTLRTVHDSAASAQRAADAELDRLSRAAKGALSLTLVGDSNLAAGTRMSVSGVRTSIDGAWVVKTVTHNLDWAGGGFTSAIDGERS
jgi:uncharacterized protein